jgi:GAF domain-containing protein
MPDSDINVVITRLGLLSDDVGELKETLRQIATAVTRLALVEERQSQTNEALSRAFKQIDKVELKLTGIEQRLGSLERLQPQQQQTSAWVTTMLWATAGAAVMFVAKKVGFLP